MNNLLGLGPYIRYVPCVGLKLLFSHSGAYPTYHCNVPIDYEKNETLSMYLPEVCDDNGNCALSSCYMWSNYSDDVQFDNVTAVECVDGIYFYPDDPFESTIVTQVC